MPVWRISDAIHGIGPLSHSGAVLMPATGTNYHCTLHAAMIGSVSAASGAPPPPCEGIYC